MKIGRLQCCSSSLNDAMQQDDWLIEMNTHTHTHTEHDTDMSQVMSANKPAIPDEASTVMWVYTRDIMSHVIVITLYTIAHFVCSFILLRCSFLLFCFSKYWWIRYILCRLIHFQHLLLADEYTCIHYITCRSINVAKIATGTKRVTCMHATDLIRVLYVLSHIKPLTGVHSIQLGVARSHVTD